MIDRQLCMNQSKDTKTLPSKSQTELTSEETVIGDVNGSVHLTRSPLSYRALFLTHPEHVPEIWVPESEGDV